MQQFNDLKHSSKTTKEWLQRKRIHTQNVVVKDVALCPSNFSQLAEEEWAKIPIIRCERLVSGFRRHNGCKRRSKLLTKRVHMLLHIKFSVFVK